MIWELKKKDGYLVYYNRDIDLKVKIVEKNEREEIHLNYKGYNVTVPMLIWEFGEDLKLASIEDVSIEGENRFDKHFVINKKDREHFLEEVYFFLIDNKLDSVKEEKYRANWK